MLQAIGAARQFNIDDINNSRFRTSVAPPGVRFRPLPITWPFSYNSATYIEIDNNDVSAQAGSDPGIEWESVQLSLNMTRQSNQVTLSYKKRNTDNNIATVNSNVKIYDTGSLIFQGVVTKIQTVQLSAVLLRVTITAVDYTNEMDGKLINENFAGQTINQIIAYLISKYAPQFTMNNVNAPTIIQNIAFTLEPFSKCLQDLAGMTGFDWYVDQYKDIHFVDATQTVVAPISITDSNGSFEEGTLAFDDDITQLKNSVYVRGGVAVGSSTTTSLVAAAGTVQTVFQCGYHFSAKPTVTNAGSAQTVGTLNVDNAASFQCMWDAANDTIVFASAVTGGNTVAITGTPQNPIRVYIPNRSSMATYGERQLLIQDSTIVSYSAAIQRAQAELLKYAQTVVSASFITRTKGVLPGQYITINSSQFGKNAKYIVTQVGVRFFGPTSIEYNVTCISTKLFDIIDLMIQVLRQPNKQTSYPANESYDPAEAAFETATFTESTVVTSGAHNPQTESTTSTDSASLPGGTGLNAGIIYVAGPYAPSGTKREFNVDRSFLG